MSFLVRVDLTPVPEGHDSDPPFLEFGPFGVDEAVQKASSYAASSAHAIRTEDGMICYPQHRILRVRVVEVSE